MVEILTPASINETFRALTDLSLAATAIVRKLISLREQARAGEDTAREQRKWERRLDALEAQIATEESSLMLLMGEPPGAAN